MSPAEMIRKFYDGSSIASICQERGDTSSEGFDLIEMLVRGYGIGLEAAGDDSHRVAHGCTWVDCDECCDREMKARAWDQQAAEAVATLPEDD